MKFQPQLRKTQDRVFMLYTFAAAGKILYAPVLSYIYCVNEQSITHVMNFKMLDYCFRVYEAMNGWCSSHNPSPQDRKFFSYALFFEMISLTYIHPSCSLSLAGKVRCIAEQYDRFNVGRDAKLCKVSEYNTIKSKINLLVRKIFGKWGYAVFIIAWRKAKFFIKRQ